MCVCGGAVVWNPPNKKSSQYPLLQEPGGKPENHFSELIFQLFFFFHFTPFPIKTWILYEKENK